MTNPDHIASVIVWDGRDVVATYAGDDREVNKADARAHADQLRDAGNPDVAVWEQRHCAYVNAAIRADEQHLMVLNCEGTALLAHARALSQIRSVHAAKGARCVACGELWPCQTHRLATAPLIT